jgi:RHS repeat-associated protein
MTDINGTTTSYTYDARQRVKTVTVSSSSGARTTSYTYDGVGQVTKVVMPDGLIINNTYNSARYLEAVEDNQGNRIEYRYDLKGNRTDAQTRDSSGNLERIVTAAFDHRDQVTQINAAGSITQMVKDAVGNMTSQTDPNANPATRHTFDALDRLNLYIDAIGGSTAYHYDIQDQLVRVNTPNGATTRYQYDDLGNLLSEASPDRGLLTYTHDDAGNVLTKIDARGVTATYRYDALNRLLGVTYPDGKENVTVVYDTCSHGGGRPCEIYDESGVTTFNYDSYGNVLSESRLQDGISYLTSYTYDNANRVLSMTYPNGRIVTVQRDSLGRAKTLDSTLDNTLQSIVHSRKFRADGFLLSQVFGNGLVETRDYDLQGRLIEKTIDSHQTRGYTYDANGNLKNILRAKEPVSYDYDALNRLESEHIEREIDTVISNTASAWRYDSNGNRVSQISGEAAKTYRYTPLTNQLVQRGNKVYVLDAMGNTLSDKNDKRVFEYNGAGRLVRFTENGKLKAEYVYNAHNQRTKKVLHKRPDQFGNSVSHTFLYFYDLNGMLISEFKNSKPLRDYIWADGVPVQQDAVKLKKTGETVVKHSLSLITDHLNTPRVGVDESKTIVWTWNSNAFGEGGVNKDPDGDGIKHNLRIRFPGQFSDPESGLYYNWNRYYDPQTGRYITSDPIGLEGGINTYGYALANPARFFDPFGLDVVKIGINIRVPSWLTGGTGQGGGIGAAISFPGINGGNWDSGGYVEGYGGGSDYGTGRITVGVGYEGGDVQSLTGDGSTVGFNDGLGGLSISLDNNDRLNGVGLHLGPGLNVGGAGTQTVSYGFRDVAEDLRGLFGGDNDTCP